MVEFICGFSSLLYHWPTIQSSLWLEYKWTLTWQHDFHCLISSLPKLPFSVHVTQELENPTTSPENQLHSLEWCQICASFFYRWDCPDPEDLLFIITGIGRVCQPLINILQNRLPLLFWVCKTVFACASQKKITLLDLLPYFQPFSEMFTCYLIKMLLDQTFEHVLYMSLSVTFVNSPEGSSFREASEHICTHTHIWEINLVLFLMAYI